MMEKGFAIARMRIFQITGSEILGSLFVQNTLIVYNFLTIEPNPEQSKAMKPRIV